MHMFVRRYRPRATNVAAHCHRLICPSRNHHHRLYLKRIPVVCLGVPDPLQQQRCAVGDLQRSKFYTGQGNTSTTWMICACSACLSFPSDQCKWIELSQRMPIGTYNWSVSIATNIASDVYGRKGRQPVVNVKCCRFRVRTVESGHLGINNELI